MLRELAGQGDAPALLGRCAGSGAPRLAITVSGLAGALVAFSSILAPDTIFAFLLSCSGGVILLIYSLIVTAHVVSRKAAERAGQGRFGLPLFPLTNYATLAGVVIVFGSMLYNPTERMTALASLGTSVVCFGLASFFMARRAD